MRQPPRKVRGKGGASRPQARQVRLRLPGRPHLPVVRTCALECYLFQMSLWSIVLLAAHSLSAVRATCHGVCGAATWIRAREGGATTPRGARYPHNYAVSVYLGLPSIRIRIPRPPKYTYP